MNVYLSVPVNKTAALVINQSGCSNTFLLTANEQVKILGIRKNELSKQIKQIKIEMGANRKLNNNKLPKFILKHPRYKELMRLVNEVNDIEKQIPLLKEKTREHRAKYNKYFFRIMKERYPRQYEEVRREAMKQSIEEN